MKLFNKIYLITLFILFSLGSSDLLLAMQKPKIVHKGQAKSKPQAKPKSQAKPQPKKNESALDKDLKAAIAASLAMENESALDKDTKAAIAASLEIESESDLDEETKAALTSSMETLPGPLKYYTENFENKGIIPTADNTPSILLNCDSTNKAAVFKPGRIPFLTQIPVLYQQYPCLANYGEYGPNSGLLCGIYAIHFAKLLTLNFSESKEDLIELLNGRETFERTLVQSKEILLNLRKNKENAGSWDSLDGDEIHEIIHSLPDMPDEEKQSITIYDAVLEADALDQHTGLPSRVEMFKQGHIPFLVYIMRPGLVNAKYTHWIALLIRRTQDNNTEAIICDSLAIDRQADTAVIARYREIVPEQTWAQWMLSFVL